tara:strand:- start:1301 stop:2386 length:1086 start_codon:yes stop_codon:yes gene_type:complete
LLAENEDIVVSIKQFCIGNTFQSLAFFLKKKSEKKQDKKMRTRASASLSINSVAAIHARHGVMFTLSNPDVVYLHEKKLNIQTPTWYRNLKEKHGSQKIHVYRSTSLALLLWYYPQEESWVYIDEYDMGLEEENKEYSSFIEKFLMEPYSHYSSQFISVIHASKQARMSNSTFSSPSTPSSIPSSTPSSIPISASSSASLSASSSASAYSSATPLPFNTANVHNHVQHGKKILTNAKLKNAQRRESYNAIPGNENKGASSLNGGNMYGNTLNHTLNMLCHFTGQLPLPVYRSLGSANTTVSSQALDSAAKSCIFHDTNPCILKSILDSFSIVRPLVPNDDDFNAACVSLLTHYKVFPDNVC